MAEICKIVLTGGPCGGKSTAIGYIKAFFEEKGYKVIFVSETATEILKEGSIERGTAEFRREFFKRQLYKEKLAYEQAEGKTLIVCDRGIMDSAAYTNPDIFKNTLAELGLHPVQVRDSYDAVFHLVTAADGAEGFYTCNNNEVRTETAQEAISQDRKTLAVWVGHSHLRVIDNRSGFEDKMKRLVEEIAFFLGIPKRLEIERKLLIEYPDIKTLEENPLCRHVDIEQIYLKSLNGASRRIRKRGEQGFFTCYLTEKKKISATVREENERIITAGEYAELENLADEGCVPIKKKRYLLMYEGTYFEIDIFPFWRDKAFLEVELKSENEGFVLPPFIKVIKDVTEDEEYTNHALARRRNI